MGTLTTKNGKFPDGSEVLVSFDKGKTYHSLAPLTDITAFEYNRMTFVERCKMWWNMRPWNWYGKKG